jgi:hypothetical protein
VEMTGHPAAHDAFLLPGLAEPIAKYAPNRVQAIALRIFSDDAHVQSKHRGRGSTELGAMRSVSALTVSAVLLGWAGVPRSGRQSHVHRPALPRLVGGRRELSRLGKGRPDSNLEGAAALGVSVLEIGLRGTAGAMLVRIGVAAFVMAAVVALVAAVLDGQEPMAPLMTAMVVALFVAEAILGVAVAVSDLLPVWVGWAITAWNPGCLALLLQIRASDVYYPVVDFVCWR